MQSILTPMNPQPFSLHHQTTPHQHQQGAAAPMPLGGAPPPPGLPMPTQVSPQQQLFHQQQQQQGYMLQAQQPQQPQEHFFQPQAQGMMQPHLAVLDPPQVPPSLIMPGQRRDSALSNNSEQGASPFAPQPGSFPLKMGAVGTPRGSFDSIVSSRSRQGSFGVDTTSPLPVTSLGQPAMLVAQTGLLPAGNSPQTTFAPMAHQHVGSGLPMILATPPQQLVQAPAQQGFPTGSTNLVQAPSLCPSPSSGSPSGVQLANGVQPQFPSTAPFMQQQCQMPSAPPPSMSLGDAMRRGSTGAMGVAGSMTAAVAQPMGSNVLNSMKVYIRHVGSSTNEDDIRKFASRFGNIRRVEKQRERGGTTFCCYITFETAQGAQNCTSSGNGSTYFANLCAERGETAHLPPLSIRMAESLEERHDRITRRSSGSGGPGGPCEAPTTGNGSPPPPPPYGPIAPIMQAGPVQQQAISTSATTTGSPVESPGNNNALFVLVPHGQQQQQQPAVASPSSQ